MKTGQSISDGEPSVSKKTPPVRRAHSKKGNAQSGWAVWKHRLPWIWAGVISPLLAGLAFWHSHEANQLAKIGISQQTIPQLSIELRPERVHVGPMQGRQDDVVTVPISINNDGLATAYDVVVDLVISYDNGLQGVSLNDYFRGINSPIIRKDRLAGGETWNLPALAPSVAANAYEVYKSGQFMCRIKVPLSWKDTTGKQYRWITTAGLEYKPQIEGYGETFWWNLTGSYSSERDSQQLKKLWNNLF